MKINKNVIREVLFSEDFEKVIRISPDKKLILNSLAVYKIVNDYIDSIVPFSVYRIENDVEIHPLLENENNAYKIIGYRSILCDELVIEADDYFDFDMDKNGNITVLQLHDKYDNIMINE